MSKSYDYCMIAAADKERSSFCDCDWNKATEQDSESFFDQYLKGERNLIVEGRDENGDRIHLEVSLSFSADANFQYFTSVSCRSDGTLLFMEDLKEKIVNKVCCAQTVYKKLLPVKNGSNIHYTVGNFVILSEDCESPDSEKPWLTDRFIVLLPLRTEIIENEKT